jgi:hypothetical protein
MTPSCSFDRFRRTGFRSFTPTAKAATRSLWLGVLLCLVLCSRPACAKDRPELPPDIGSAKSIAILVRLIGSSPTTAWEAEKRSSAEAEITKQGRFEIVDDPYGADLVCMIINWAPHLVGKISYFYTLETILIFKGAKEWTATPIWMASDMWLMEKQGGTGWALDRFHKDVRNAEKQRGQNGSYRPPTVPSARMVDAAFAPAYSQSGGGRLPREIYASKAVMLFCREGGHECNKTRFEKHIREAGRWTIVTDPAKADLILVWSEVHMYAQRSGNVTFSGDYSPLFVLRTGTWPHWNAIPLYSMVGSNALPLLENLQKEVASSSSPNPN